MKIIFREDPYNVENINMVFNNSITGDWLDITITQNFNNNTHVFTGIQNGRQHGAGIVYKNRNIISQLIKYYFNVTDLSYYTHFTVYFNPKTVFIEDIEIFKHKLRQLIK